MSVQLVAQNLPEIIDAQQIDTILRSGPKDNRINFAIQNRGVDGGGDFANREEFVQLFTDDLYRTFTLGDEFEKPPYAQYRDFFNLYAYWWPNALSESEGWNFQILHGVRDHFFLPWSNDSTGWITFFSSTRHGGGGGAGLERDRRVGSGKMYGMGWETFLHEFGHTMPGQLDEYTSSGIWSNGACWETPNTTAGMTRDDVPWRKWIDESTPIPTPYDENHLDVIGVFEGALTNYYGCFRPTARGCIMGAGGFGEDYGQSLCSPCIQRIICNIYEYVNPIESTIPAENELAVSGDTTIQFSVNVLHPTPNTQRYAWILNGKIIARDVTSVEVSFSKCDTYELLFTLLDTNTLIRYDSKFDHIYPRPYKQYKWTIDQVDINAYQLNAEVVAQNADCTGVPNGEITIYASGGLAPYTFRATGAEGDVDLQGLAPGSYDVFITDANGCGIAQDVVLGQDSILTAKITSETQGDNWLLSVLPDNYPPENLVYTWSNGASTQSTVALEDGMYSVTVETAEGCGMTFYIVLVKPKTDLKVFEAYSNSSVDHPSGRILLNITDGRPPYTVKWWDGAYEDGTFPSPERAIASGTTWDHLPEYAFDDDLATKWLHFTPNGEGGPPWIGFDFQESTSVSYYVITSADDVPGRDPKNWEFQGSNDGQNWIVLDEQTGQIFPSRFEDHIYPISNVNEYRQYRLFVTENHGDGATQIQELALYGATDLLMERNDISSDQLGREGLWPGTYAFEVCDANNTMVSGQVDINFLESENDNLFQVIQQSFYEVGIDAPAYGNQYYWFSDRNGLNVLHVGSTFQPKKPGNYYAACLDDETKALSDIIGFAVTMPMPPQVDTLDSKTLYVIDPKPNEEYYWYDVECYGEPVHQGQSIEPGQTSGFFYVAARPIIPIVAPVDPTTVDGLLLQMDASDLNGDGQVDNPAPETSSTLEWVFPNSENRLSTGSWFAYDAIAQNGLGVANFATLWLQRVEEGVRDYQTILMVYDESQLSFPERGPFEALSYHMPKHEDSTRLFSNNTPATTLNGKTYLNGVQVDPQNTPNPMDFCILGTVLTEKSDRDFFYTDTHWEGRLAEMLLWDRALTDEELVGLSEHLRRKWITTADLESARTGVYWDGGTVSTEPTAHSDSGYRLTLAPNPAVDQVRAMFDIPESKQMELLFYNGRGQLITNQIVPAGTEVMTINISQLPAGEYFVSLNVDRRIVSVQKLIVLK